MSYYKVKQGESLPGIAVKHGFFWKTIWDLDQNKELKDKRKDPFVLFPGDTIFIPEKKVIKEENCQVNKENIFIRKGMLTKFRLRLLENDKPLADTQYTLQVDKKFYYGLTDGEGWLEQMIPVTAKKGLLLVGKTEDEEGVPLLPQIEYELHFGHIDPIDTVSGIQERLNNLGFYCGEESGELTESTINAIEEFQEKFELGINGEINEETIRKLEEIYNG